MLPQGQETRPTEPALPVPSCSDAHLGTACLAQLSLCPSHSSKPTESSRAAYFLMDIPTAPVRDSLLPHSLAPTPRPRQCLPGAVVGAEPCATLRSTHSSMPSPQAQSGYSTSHKLGTTKHPNPSVCCMHRVKADTDAHFPAPSPSVPLSFTPCSPSPRSPGSGVPSRGRAPWGHHRSTSPAWRTHPQHSTECRHTENAERSSGPSPFVQGAAGTKGDASAPHAAEAQPRLTPTTPAPALHGASGHCPGTRRAHREWTDGHSPVPPPRPTLCPTLVSLCLLPSANAAPKLGSEAFLLSLTLRSV